MACCIIGCRTNYKPTKKYPNPTKHSCFYFPKDFEQRNLWIAAVRLKCNVLFLISMKYTVFLTFNKSPYSYLPALLQTPTRNDNNQKPRFLLISLHLSLQWQKRNESFISSWSQKFARVAPPPFLLHAMVDRFHKKVNRGPWPR